AGERRRVHRRESLLPARIAAQARQIVVDARLADETRVGLGHLVEGAEGGVLVAEARVAAGGVVRRQRRTEAGGGRRLDRGHGLLELSLLEEIGARLIGLRAIERRRGDDDPQDERASEHAPTSHARARYRRVAL